MQRHNDFPTYFVDASDSYGGRLEDYFLSDEAGVECRRRRVVFQLLTDDSDAEKCFLAHVNFMRNAVKQKQLDWILGSFFTPLIYDWLRFVLCFVRFNIVLHRRGNS